MINRAILTGRLTKDADLRYTQSGIATASFTLAVNRQFTNKQTNEREADFVSCVIWRKSAENFCNFTHKGSLVGLDGRIQTRHYENQQGATVYVTEVVVDNFSLLEPKPQGQSGFPQQENQNTGFPQTGQQSGYGRQGNQNGFPQSNGQDAFSNLGDQVAAASTQSGGNLPPEPPVNSNTNWTGLDEKDLPF